ncbi:MAG TPA: ribokinase [Cellulomonas sp.]
MTDDRTPAPLPITVVGSVNHDVVHRVHRLPRPGETVHAVDVTDGLGGKGANQAVAAARLGGRVRLVAAVGHDGDPVLAALRREGVEVAARVVTDVRTGSATVVVDDDADNVVVVCAGANGHLAPHDVPPTIGGVLLVQHEVPDAVVARAVREAAPGTLVLLNPAPYRTVPPSVLARVDVLVLNQTELALLVGAAPPRTVQEAHRLLLAAGRRAGAAVVATLGADGALLHDGTGLRHVPGVTVHAVDTVGAGDTFCGALAAALARGEDLHRAVVLGVHAAALAVTAPGAQGGMPDEAELRDLLIRTGSLVDPAPPDPADRTRPGRG